MILILSDPDEDAHVSFVTEELDHRGVPYLTFDPASYPTECEIAIEKSASGAARAVIKHDDAELDTADITGAWYRRPGKPKLSEHMDPNESAWMQEECAHVLRGLYEFVPVERWMSHPANVRRAEVKFFQLKVADQLGFTLPPYLVTTSPAEAVRFMAEHGQRVVAKSLTQPFVVYEECGEVAVMYTQRLDNVAPDALAHLENGPSLLQAYVDKRADIRVTVVGDEVFAVEIEPRIHGEFIVDFRSVDVLDLPHQRVELPARLNEACVRLLEALGLAFGAIDLVVDPDERYWFLEINPNGQWMWLEWATGAPIRRSICDHLAGASPRGDRHTCSA